MISLEYLKVNKINPLYASIYWLAEMDQRQYANLPWEEKKKILQYYGRYYPLLRSMASLRRRKNKNLVKDYLNHESQTANIRSRHGNEIANLSQPWVKV